MPNLHNMEKPTILSADTLQKQTLNMLILTPTIDAIVCPFFSKFASFDAKDGNI